MRQGIFLSAVLFLLLLTAGARAISQEAANVNSSLDIAEKDMQEMLTLKMPVARYKDTLLFARQLFDAQLALEQSGKKGDYLQVAKKLTELKTIKTSAFASFDELKVLRQAIDKTLDIERAPIIELYNQAKEDCDSERYELCHANIDRTYEKISEMEAFGTKAKAFYAATSRSVSEFIRERWREIILWHFIVIASLRLTYNRVIYRSILGEINGLEGRKEAVKKLIAKTQKEYFEDGNISDTTYYIRAKKYGELIRDINRQIPLLAEELALRKKKIHPERA